MSYVILRLGFRGYGTGRLVLDSSFRKNIEGARAAGLQVGVYFFSQAINEKEAIEEASMCVQYVQGYQVDMPIFIDLEDVDPDDGSGGRANNLSVTQRTSVARAFCDTVRGAGYKAGIYASYYYLLDRMHIGQLEGITTSGWPAMPIPPAIPAAMICGSTPTTVGCRASPHGMDGPPAWI